MAAAFIAVADRYMTKRYRWSRAIPEGQHGLHPGVAHLFLWPLARAGFSRKQRAYAKAIEAFRAHARLWDPPLEIVRIPFEGSRSSGICGCRKMRRALCRLCWRSAAWIAQRRSF